MKEKLTSEQKMLMKHSLSFVIGYVHGRNNETGIDTTGFSDEYFEGLKKGKAKAKRIHIARLKEFCKANFQEI